MIEALSSAIILGLILSFSLGPIFFELINTSLRKGFKSALFLELGVLASDIIYLLAALFSAEKVLSLIEGNDYFKLIGGAIFIAFGVVSILRSVLKKQTEENKPQLKEINDSILDHENYEEKKIKITNSVKAPRYITQIIKGITLNAINPTVLLFWIVTCSVTIKKLQGTGVNVFVFFGATLLVMFALDITKVYFASKLKKYMTTKILTIISVIIGSIMIVAGIFIMFSDFEVPTGKGFH